MAVDLPKGVDFVASILAIMLNGSSYVPIGQHQPIQRIERILSHEHITHVICYSTKYNRKDFDEKTIINIKNINSSYKIFLLCLLSPLIRLTSFSLQEVQASLKEWKLHMNKY